MTGSAQLSSALLDNWGSYNCQWMPPAPAPATPSTPAPAPAPAPSPRMKSRAVRGAEDINPFGTRSQKRQKATEVERKQLLSLVFGNGKQDMSAHKLKWVSSSSSSLLLIFFLASLYHYQRKDNNWGPASPEVIMLEFSKAFCDAIRSSDELITICPAPQHNCITHIHREYNENITAPPVSTMKSCPTRGSKSNKQLIGSPYYYYILDTWHDSQDNTHHISRDKDFHCASIVRIEEEPKVSRYPDTQVANNRDLHRRSAALLNKCVPIEWNLLWSEARRIVKYLPANRLWTQHIKKYIESRINYE